MVFIEFPCPNPECWTFNHIAQQCKLRDNTLCKYSLSCKYGEMEFVFPPAMFGTNVEEETFDETAECQPVYDSDADRFTWSSALGACGQELTQHK